jgi:hypothetical protein
LFLANTFSNKGKKQKAQVRIGTCGSFRCFLADLKYGGWAEPALGTLFLDDPVK